MDLVGCLLWLGESGVLKWRSGIADGNEFFLKKVMKHISPS